MVVALAATMTASAVSAQSLADVARQEEARRKSVKEPAKVLTNADLKPDPTAAAPSDAAVPEGGYASASLDRDVTADEIIANSKKRIATAEMAKQEPQWRGQAAAIRDQLLKTQRVVQSMASTAADESRSGGERAAAEKILSQQTTLLEGLEGRWVEFAKEADTALVPKVWLEPIPTLSTRPPK